VTKNVTPICMNCKNTSPVVWFDISYNPSTNLGYTLTSITIGTQGGDTTQIDFTHTNNVGATIQ